MKPQNTGPAPKPKVPKKKFTVPKVAMKAKKEALAPKPAAPKKVGLGAQAGGGVTPKSVTAAAYAKLLAQDLKRYQAQQAALRNPKTPTPKPAGQSSDWATAQAYVNTVTDNGTLQGKFAKKLKGQK